MHGYHIIYEPTNYFLEVFPFIGKNLVISSAYFFLKGYRLTTRELFIKKGYLVYEVINLKERLSKISSGNKLKDYLSSQIR